NASTYFPANPGYKWYYKNTPLDSLNNPQNNLSTYRIDSFAVNQNYQGLPASLLLSKSGLTSIFQNAPYTDSNHYNFQSTNAYYYLNLLNLIGTIPGIDSIAFIAFLRSFETWYNTYRFSQTVNTNYTIFTRDTTITIDTLTLPLRLSAVGRRYNDQTISTINGNVLAKKFLITFNLSYLLTIPPLPPIPVPLIVRPDTTYIASGIWIVKDVIPSVNVDLSSLGFPISFSIPGSLTELTSNTVGINSPSNNISNDFYLSQNFPNPFNPTTTITYRLGNLNFVSMKVFDIQGKEIATLVNEKQNAGSYSVEFNGEDLPSGVYYYKLEAGNFSQTNKMLLIK
nr:T9SS type A sorting domain-containing protein [Ignavibacteria bacterium]